MATKRKKEVELYDYFNGDKGLLRYKDRAAVVKDPGVVRASRSDMYGTADDNLCKLWWGDMLTGEALAEAPLVCPVKPEGYVLPDRFYKPLTESGQDYP